MTGPTSSSNGETALQRILAALTDHGRSYHLNSETYEAQCPSHNDDSPSLAVMSNSGKVLICCHSGCSLDRILDALHLTMADLFDGCVVSSHGTSSAPLDRETAREIEAPHTLTLSTWDGELYNGEDAHRWDQANIECPHQPATETMPCAMWEPCGCPTDLTEIALYDGGSGDGSGLCSRSATRTHHYIDGEPTRPVASCWTQDWVDSIADRAFDLGLMPGTHLVRPWWDGDRVQLELVKPQAVTR